MDRLLVRSHIFWDHSWPARAIGGIEARRSFKLLARRGVDAACVVPLGPVPEMNRFTGARFSPALHEALWLHHGTDAQKMSAACAALLEPAAVYGGINVIQVLSAQIILKLLPLLNFLYSFERWCDEVRGSRAAVAVSSAMQAVLRPLADRSGVSVEWVSVSAAERIQCLRAKFYRPVAGWNEWTHVATGTDGPSGTQVDVLFTVCAGSPVKIVRRVAEQIAQAGLTSAAVTLEGTPIRDLPMPSCSPVTGRPFSRQRVDRGLERQMELVEPELKAVFHYKGISLWPLMRQVLLANIRTMSSAVAQAVDGLNELFHKMRPKVLVVSNNSVWSDRVAILVARHAGIPSVAIQDGDYQPVWPWEILSDRIAVQGEQSKRVLEAFGSPSAKIETTGQVRYDHLRAEPVNGQTRHTVRGKLGIGTSPLAVVATDPGSLTQGPAEKLRYESYVVDEFSAEPEWKLLFKLHPQDKGESVRQLAGKGTFLVVGSEFSAEELIAACDLWIATASTTAVEAAVLGRPVVLLDCDGHNFMRELVETGLAVYVRAAGDLRRVVSCTPRGQIDAAVSAGREAFVRDRLYKLDGQAAARVVALIRETASI